MHRSHTLYMHCISLTLSCSSWENSWAPLFETTEESEEKNWSSELMAALADWLDKLVNDDERVSVFSPINSNTGI